MPAIRTHVSVPSHPTVVKLTELDAPWIVDSYHLTPQVRGLVDRVVHAAAGPTGTGAFLIGPYGSGKSHFLAWLARRLSSLVEPPPDVRVVSLLDYPAEARLEDIVSEAMGVQGGTSDRRPRWAAAMAAHPSGVVLLIDELSEFLRSKPTPASFNEDVRTLQFLGEWSSEARCTVIAAMQEQIEHTGELDSGLYRKIKDRFPVRLTLNEIHTRALIADHLLCKGPGYAAAAEELVKRLRQALPDAPFADADLAAIYPIHPTTLELLDEVRDAFSQTRGVVDFVLTRLRGDAGRGVAPFLDEPWGALVTPDLIVEHFSEVLALNSAYLPVGQRLLPWAQRHLDELFETPALVALAHRILRLLIVAWLSPARAGLAPGEVAGMLLFAPSKLDPQRNLAVIGRVLGRLATDGRYVREEDGRYRLDLDDDSAEQLERLVDRARPEVPASEEALFALLASALDSARFAPLSLAQEQWSPRSVRWSSHERTVELWIGNGTPSAPTHAAACVRLPWGKPRPALGLVTLVPRTLSAEARHRTLAAQLLLRERVLGPDVRERLHRALAEGVAAFQGEVRGAFAEATLVDAEGHRLAPVPLERSMTTERWVTELGRVALRARYPSFELYAPTSGPLPRAAWQGFWRYLSAGGTLTSEAGSDTWLDLVREGYLLPMRLLKRRGRAFELAPTQRHDLVRLVLSLAEQGKTPEQVYARLAAPVFGLVPDQITALLALLHAQGDIDVVQGARQWRDAWATLPNPLQYEAIEVGRALSTEHARSLRLVCEGLSVSVPKTWTASAQRRAVGRLRERLERVAGGVRPLVPRLADAEADELLAAIASFTDDCAALAHDDELHGVELLLGRVGSASDLIRITTQLEELPRRIERQHRELRRYAHLAGALRDRPLAGELAELKDPPNLSDGSAVERWLFQAKRAHDAYKAAYRSAHRAWLEGLPAVPGPPPPLARSRHVGLQAELAQLSEAASEVARRRCTRLSDLDLQPECSCGFDGARAPLDTALRALSEASGRVEHGLVSFFGQPEVRERVRTWAEDTGDTEGTAGYLEGRDRWPAISELDAFDRHMAGVAVVREVPLDALGAWLAEGTWRTDRLVAAFGERARGWGERVRFTSLAASTEVEDWCVGRALATGVRLPPGVTAGTIDPMQVRPEGLARLEELGLRDDAVDAVLSLLWTSRMPVPDGATSPVVAALRDAVAPGSATDEAGTAVRIALLYGAHDRLRHTGGARWLAHLERVVEPRLSPPPLVDLLAECRDRPWCLLDAAGLALWPALGEALGELFPAWRLQRVRFADVGPRTTTAACGEALLAAGLDVPFAKVDAVDEVLHEGFLPFDDLCRVAIARLRPALRRRLEPGKPLVVFADHGFRLSVDGSRWVHGGASDAERIVPVIELLPR